MQRDLAIGLMRRAIKVAETQWPEMADANMEVPLDYFTDEEIAAQGAGAVRDVSHWRSWPRPRSRTRTTTSCATRSVARSCSRATRTGSRTRSSTTAATEAPSPRTDAATSAASRARTTRGCTTRRASSSGCRCATATTGSTSRSTGWSSSRARSATASCGSCCGVTIPIDVAAHLGELDAEIGSAGLRPHAVLLVDRRSTARGQLEVGRRGPARGAARSLRARRHVQPEPAGGERRPRVLRRHRSRTSAGACPCSARTKPSSSQRPPRTSGAPTRRSAASG